MRPIVGENNASFENNTSQSISVATVQRPTVTTFARAFSEGFVYSDTLLFNTLTGQQLPETMVTPLVFGEVYNVSNEAITASPSVVLIRDRHCNIVVNTGTRVHWKKIESGNDSL